MRYQYPHTIDNGNGEKLTFLRVVESPDGDILEIENEVQPGHGPPLHVHHKQLESLTVIKGKMAVQRNNGAAEYFEAGQTGAFQPGDAHKFWNAGDDLLVCSGFVKPVHNLEYFLTEIFKSTKNNGGRAPSQFDGAYLMKRYETEFDMLEIPGFVKKVIFPVVLFFGKLAGKHTKFADAPESVK